MIDENIHDLIVQQMLAVHAVFPRLDLEKKENGHFVISGMIDFKMEKDGIEVADSYLIEVIISPDYPKVVPTVKAVGGRIPKEFHTYPLDGTLCLGMPLAVEMTFAKNPCLLEFLRNQVAPYLFSHSYKERYGSMPHGELAHGAEGLLQGYSQMFGVDQPRAVLGLLRILADHDYKGHTLCPCNSGQKLRKCHGPQILEIQQYMREYDFLDEYCKILTYVKGDNSLLHYKDLLSKKILRWVRKKRKRR